MKSARLFSVSTDVNSKKMRAVRRRDTPAEIRVRSASHRLGLRFRLCDRTLPGSPDIVFPRHHVCIFVHGCFWHRHPDCKKTTMPKSNVVFWTKKFDQNVTRDARKVTALQDLGWRVETIWECETEDPVLLGRILRRIFAL